MQSGRPCTEGLTLFYEKMHYDTMKINNGQDKSDGDDIMLSL